MSCKYLFTIIGNVSDNQVIQQNLIITENNTCLCLQEQVEIFWNN
jgi:hypothetical protein